jgi:hypothetical protein
MWASLWMPRHDALLYISFCFKHQRKRCGHSNYAFLWYAETHYDHRMLEIILPLLVLSVGSKDNSNEITLPAMQPVA